MDYSQELKENIWWEKLKKKYLITQGGHIRPQRKERNQKEINERNTIK